LTNCLRKAVETDRKLIMALSQKMAGSRDRREQAAA
jgi:hypothetical protein